MKELNVLVIQIQTKKIQLKKLEKKKMVDLRHLENWKLYQFQQLLTHPNFAT